LEGRVQISPDRGNMTRILRDAYFMTGSILHAVFLYRRIRMSVEAVKKIGSFNYEINVGANRLISDMRFDLGESGAGPEPHDLLESALAACTAITIQKFADQKNIPLECCDVKINIVAVGSSNTIEREITLVGELLTEDERQMLFSIAEESPICKFLSKGAQIQSKLNSAELFVGL